MSRDLGAPAPQVHEAAREVLDFWFALTTERHFSVDEQLDRTITDRFATLHAELAATRAEGWQGDPETLLAAIIVLDQFSRNMFRGSPAAFAQDALATELALSAIERQWDAEMPPEHRVFVYLPLMHAEDLDLQNLSVARYEVLGIRNNLDFARRHRDVIARFGRYPSRNEALGRATTPEEQAFVDRGGGW